MWGANTAVHKSGSFLSADTFGAETHIEKYALVRYRDACVRVRVPSFTRVPARARCVGANARCARRCVEYSKFRQTAEPIASNMRIDAVRE